VRKRRLIQSQHSALKLCLRQLLVCTAQLVASTVIRAYRFSDDSGSSTPAISYVLLGVISQRQSTCVLQVVILGHSAPFVLVNMKCAIEIDTSGGITSSFGEIKASSLIL
jgi:hypothetical protein